MAPAANVPSNIEVLVGPNLLGNSIAYLLYGILMSQIYVYHHRFPEDHTWIKALVWTLFVVETVLIICGSMSTWNAVVGGWGDVNTLELIDWPTALISFLLSGVASSIHIFYSWRIWKLRKSIIFPIIIITVSAAAFVMGLMTGFYGKKLTISEVTVKLKPYVIAWLGGNVLVNLMITIIMCITLMEASSQSMFGHTVSMLSRTITITVETGMINAVGALVDMILFLALPRTHFYLMVYYFLSKLYTNTLLVTLNARGGNIHRAAFWNTDSQRKPTRSALFTRPDGTTTGAIQVSTVIERHEHTDVKFFTPKASIDTDRLTPMLT
ncbi:hypothetical protein BD779DRAFT_1668768 [Infundibulicybe gibba]|nr:hypothetical protein BD779DRAFT_1668768 [Infundibulicybe gibba]